MIICPLDCPFAEMLYNAGDFRMLVEATLLKKWWRSDRLWTSNAFYRRFRRIALWIDTHSLMRSQYWPREKLIAFQDKKIDALLRRASALPFWHAILARAQVDLAECMDLKVLRRLPITTKGDFRRETVHEYTSTDLVRTSFLDRSSGSTGKPFGFYHDRSFELRSFAVCERIFLTAGGGARYPVISMRAKNRRGFAFSNFHFFHVRGYHAIRHRLAHLRELISSLTENVILFGVSSSLMELARLAREQNVDLPFRAILAAGEELAEPQRREIENALGAQVFMYYALSEVGRLAFECPERHLHLCDEWAYIEIIDDAGNVLPPGSEGRVIVTAFENHVMPFIRYDTGDRGIIVEDDCPCGRTLRTMRLRGRQIDLIEFSDGRTVSPVDVAAVFHRNLSAVHQFQIVRTGDHTFLVRVVAGRDFDGALSMLTEQLAQMLHPSATVTLDAGATLVTGPNGKAITYIDERKADHA